MPFSLLRSFVLACGSAARPTRRHRRGVGPRSREASVGLESLEQRMALTVAAPSIRLAAASDTGLRNDGITRFARPVFTGTAPARSSVVVFADGQPIGSTRAGVNGAWSLATAKPLTTGAHIITAQAALNRQTSTATPMWMAVDPTPPTASLAYDPTFKATPTGPVTGRAILTFSEPVQAQGVKLANMLFTDHGARLTVPLGSPLLRTYVGAITMTQLSDRSYAFTPAVQAFAPGIYSLTFQKTGVADRAGNPLAGLAGNPLAGAVTSFRIA
jgi:hypothetical protein